MEQVFLWCDHTYMHVSVGQWCYKYTPQLFLWPVETFWREGERSISYSWPLPRQTHHPPTRSLWIIR